VAPGFLVEGALGKNLKFRDLSKRLAGPANAAWALLRLWSFVAIFRPDGDLTGIDPAEVPLTQTEWKALIEARKEGSNVGFLEVSEDVVVVHDWPKDEQRLGWLERRRIAGSIAGQASVVSRRAAGEQAFKAGMRAIHSTKPLPLGEPSNGDGKAEGKPAAAKQSPLIDRALERWLDTGFEWFYGIFPKHEGRREARKAWAKLHRDLLVSDERKGISKDVRIAIAKYITLKLRSGEWEASSDRKKFIPHPSTFLNQRQWEV
jgi:hypothetical protein